MPEDNYQPADQILVPIVRQPGAILSSYNKNSSRLYNSPTPYTDYGSIGPKQPFVYIKASDSTLSRNLTKYDSQALPIGSTIRDLNRIGQFSVTGTGLLFYGKQLLLQRQNSFNETRIYNPLSVLKATAKPGSTGLIDYPQRHLETSGGLLNFFKDAVMSTLGLQTKSTDNAPIEGTATGAKGALAWSTYAGIHGGARSGVVRFNTGNTALTNFNKYWVSSTSGVKGNFMTDLGNSLINKLKSFIPSTNPMGAFGGSTSIKWEYRPEYPTGNAGVYYRFLSDSSGFFKVSTQASSEFYNMGATDPKSPATKYARDFHKYFPQKTPGDASTGVVYASTEKIRVTSEKTGQFKVDNTVGMIGSVKGDNNLRVMYNRMLDAITAPKTDIPQFKASAHMYSTVKDYPSPGHPETEYPSYKKIPSTEDDKFYFTIKDKGGKDLDSRGFAEASQYSNISQGGVTRDSHDRYNALLPMPDGISGTVPDDLLIKGSKDQSKDIIFFYFFDLINKVHIPFRATLSGVSDQHSAEWEDISYLGRADRLFLYKGFTRDVNVSFTVYANSIKELIPMWKRINYFVGLVRPSKYTGQAVATGQPQMTDENVYRLQEGLDPVYESTSGRESRFIYPPMITMRIGDLFVDQPCVLSSIALSVPDDATWESYRGDKNYSYLYSPQKPAINIDVKSRQLPTKVDISISVKMLEKERSLGSADHYGFNMDISKG